ncbi:hypothetical protein CCR75_004085 [Bremia lactucae]|uniref:PHD-type domain-containing protein n=1 Tax=Bremia lactucae TaxID=4779 RepID=A0A976IK11_BRELC|nr:hypothetical protein CCR75_004085 [Bremia lactucae]
MTTSSPRVRFSWEDAVAQDQDLHRIDAFVKLTIFKFSGQAALRAAAFRGSSYEPVPSTVKVEQTLLVNTPTQATNGFSNASGSSGRSTPQFISVRDYQSESCSEVDTHEVNPMDELSDFEQELPQQQQEPSRDMEENALDVEMDEERTDTACEVCKKSDREDEIILCEDCNAEIHIGCLQPPLLKVPDEAWYCPNCIVKYPATSVVKIKQENEKVGTEEIIAVNDNLAKESIATNDKTAQESIAINDNSAAAPKPILNAPIAHNPPKSPTSRIDPTSIPIAEALEADPEKSNLLLIHASNCDDIKCTDPELQFFCPHMKRFLRSICWASHSDKWRSYRLARITADLFAYHAMNCSVPQCNVPLCVKIRQEEIPGVVTLEIALTSEVFTFKSGRAVEAMDG